MNRRSSAQALYLTLMIVLMFMITAVHAAAAEPTAAVGIEQLVQNDASGVPVLIGRAVTIQGVALQSTGKWHDSANYFAVVSVGEASRAGVLVYLPGSTRPRVAAGSLVEVTGTVSVRGYATDYGTTVIVPKSSEDIRIIVEGYENIDALMGTPLPTDPTYAEAEPLEGSLVRIEGRLTTYDNDGVSRGFWIDGSRDGDIEDGVGRMQVKFYDYCGLDISNLREGSYAMITGVLVQGDDTPPYHDSYYIRPTLQSYVEEDAARVRVYTAEELARQPMGITMGQSTHLADKGIYQLTTVLSSTSRPITGGLHPDYRPDGSGMAIIVGKERSARTTQENSEANLFTVSFTGEIQYRQLTFDRGMKSRPRYSPDGMRIAYGANVDPDSGGRWDIRVADPLTGNAVIVAAGAYNATNPAWSPAGDTLVYQSDESGSWDVVMGRVDGSSAPVRLTTGSADEAWPDWSPKASAIAYQADELGAAFDVWIAEVQDDTLANPRCLTAAIDGDCVTPRWSADGRRIAFCSNRGGSWDIWIVDVATGDTVRLTDLPGDESSPVWSRDGRRVAFEADLGNGANVYAVDVKKATAARLSQSPAQHVEVVHASHNGCEYLPGANGIAYPKLMQPALIQPGDSFEIVLAAVKSDAKPVRAELESPAGHFALGCDNALRGDDGLWRIIAIVPVEAPVGLYDLVVEYPAAADAADTAGAAAERAVQRRAVAIRQGGDDFTFAILADVHLNNPKSAAGGSVLNSRLASAIDDLNKLRPDFVVFLGDLVEASADTYLRDYAMIEELILERAEFPVFGVMGNHDGQRVGAIDGFAMWQASLGALYYSFDVGAWHFVMCNTYDRPEHPSDNGYVGTRQVEWVQRDMAEASARGQRIAAFVHHNVLDSRWVFVDEGRHELAATLSRTGARYVFAGHRHSDQFEMTPASRIITTRTVQAGADGETGYRLVRIEQGRMRVAPSSTPDSGQ